MTITSESKLKLKLLIEKKSQKVLFAKVGKDVVDFLISLLSLPIGSVAKLITEESTYNPLRNTYYSWVQLDQNFLSSSRMSANCFIPFSPHESSSNFAYLLSSTSPANVKEKVYGCKCNCKFTNVKCYYTPCQSCHSYMHKELSYVGPGATKEGIKRDGYVKDGVIYFVRDDLSMVPMTPLASMALVSEMGHTDLSLLEEKTVTLDVQLEGLELLKTSLGSNNVLTDMFLTKKKEGHAEEAN